MSIKYYHLAKDEELPEEFCAIRDESGEPNGYVFYVPESKVAKLRELMSVMAYCNQFRRDCDGCSMNGAAGIITERAGCDELLTRLRERGIEVEDELASSSGT